MDTQVTSQSAPATLRGAATTAPPRVAGSVVGTSAGARAGGPMSTRTPPSASRVGWISPAPVATRWGAPGAGAAPRRPSATKRARQRTPLPHISGSDPSEL